MKYDNVDKENIVFIKWYERFYNWYDDIKYEWFNS